MENGLQTLLNNQETNLDEVIQASEIVYKVFSCSRPEGKLQ